MDSLTFLQGMVGLCFATCFVIFALMIGADFAKKDESCYWEDEDDE